MANSKNKDIYYEPENYIPEDLRKKYKLGEYNEEAQEEARQLEAKMNANKEIRNFVKNK